MDCIDILFYLGLATAPFVVYLILFKRISTSMAKGNYKAPAWNYPFRLLSAKFAVKRWKSSLPQCECLETPLPTQNEGWDSITIKSCAPDGTAVLLGVRKLCGTQPLAELTIHVKLVDGTTYKLPEHPDTAVSYWEAVDHGWSAKGLHIRVLEPHSRLRIVYNGLLTKVGDKTTQHVRFNFIWSSATRVLRFPEDWSKELAAQALALESWDDQWLFELAKLGKGSWLQYGTIQGRFQAYHPDGSVDRSEYLRTRGLRERQSTSKGYEGLRRTVDITAAAKDGTLVQLTAFSYNDVLTIGFSGSVRFPDHSVASIQATDLVLSDFGETPDAVPKTYTISVTAKNRTLKLVLRVNCDGGELYSGVPYQQRVIYRTVEVGIDGYTGTGLLELGYGITGSSGPSTSLSPLPPLRWLSETDVGDVTFCAAFESRAAACPNYVGGKGASLALLSSVQKTHGYRVPPGFGLTTKALEEHLESNPCLMEAIKDIEAANDNYDERVFKEKCAKASELFCATEITGKVKEEVLTHLNELRKKAMEENLGPELRFAVRSSAVGEDSEVLSAAGQNDTVLGCATDGDVLRAVRQCWASMFAFTSAHYRRVNGQPCLCGGGVVIQALVRPRAAGVLFTRHPEAGDPSRIMITANYGLGESVVSGSVEPDTFIVSRVSGLTISTVELGSKYNRVTASGSGVATEEVPESDRRKACLTDDEVLRLARVGVTQEELWGAGRDIEWAIVQDEIFLVQARPITSLERWSEEELLHEHDSPIMADDELTTFANTGEVLPKPLTALSVDFVHEPLNRGIMLIMPQTNGDFYDNSNGLTHNRVAIFLYNSIYKDTPKEIDVTLRMLEMSVHGHKVSDEGILRSAHHRRPPQVSHAVKGAATAVKYLWYSKRCMEDTVKNVNAMNLDVQTDNMLKLWQVLADHYDTIVRCACNHGYTSAASATSQYIAMIVLVEGKSDFDPDQCNEINTLLSSGGVLSAEVPQALARLAQLVHDSGKASEFRMQDPKHALYWLRPNMPEVYREVKLFLEEHGHRGVMEFDLATKPWVMVPEELMEVLQNMRPSCKPTQPPKSNDDILASLKTPQKSSTKKVLRWLLPLCQRTIRHRESTKAHLILGIHKLRMAALRLGRQMARQWYLPDKDLVFHFRLHELKEYILKRDPALLKKASLRRQHYPTWCKLRFAELNTGWVEPLKSSGPMVTADDVRLQATSVCGGEVIARACVIKDMSEIGQLQRGDILITHSTDIGWSPYFPLLAGIVTELGGLISHGAVIAREYGLPCLVGAASATDVFRTGDTLRLSATNGLVERVQLHHTIP